MLLFIQGVEQWQDIRAGGLCLSAFYLFIMKFVLKVQYKNAV